MFLWGKKIHPATQCHVQEDLSARSLYRYCNKCIPLSSQTTKAHCRAQQPQSTRQTPSHSTFNILNPSSGFPSAYQFVFSRLPRLIHTRFIQFSLRCIKSICLLKNANYGLHLWVIFSTLLLLLLFAVTTTAQFTHTHTHTQNAK